MTNKPKPKVGDTYQCDDYATFRLNLIKHWSTKFKTKTELLPGHWVYLWRDVKSLSYRYSLSTGTKEIDVGASPSAANLMKLIWMLTPPYGECVGYYHNGDPHWKSRHTCQWPVTWDNGDFK
jgi:hypothetical protein